MSTQPEEQSAFAAVEAGDYGRALEMLDPLARQGSAYAANLIGWLHAEGKIGGARKREAVSWYRQAGEGGIVEAFYHAGSLLLEIGEKEAAREAFERGVALGNMPSMYGLGYCLEEGNDEAGKQQALEWYEKAAARGHFPARRRVLALSARKSLFNRIMYLPRLLGLAFRGAALQSKDRRSERLY